MEFRTLTVRDASGNVTPSASVSVYQRETLIPVDTFDEDGKQITDLRTNGNGVVGFAAADGVYDIVARVGSASVTIENQQFFDGLAQKDVFDGIGTDVSNLQTDVGTLQTDVGNLEDDVGEIDQNNLADVTAFFASTDTYDANTIIRTRAEGFAYRAVDTATATTVANAGGQAFEVLKIGGKYNLASFGCALDEWGTNDDAAFAKAVAAHIADRDSMLWHPGGFLTLSSTSGLGPIRIDGVGGSHTGRHSFGVIFYEEPERFSGSIIRITGTSGVGLDLGNTSDFNYGVGVNDIMIVGPGTGTGTGVRHRQVVSASFNNCIIANFHVGLDWSFSLVGSYSGCRYWGNETAILSNDVGAGNNNANHHIGHDFIHNNVDVYAKGGSQNTFRDGVFEKTKDDHFILDTTEGGFIQNWSWTDNWFEGGSVEITGYLLSFVGGDRIESIDFSSNKLRASGSFNLIAGTDNRKHRFNHNRHYSASETPMSLIIPVGMADVEAHGNTNIPVTDNSRSGWIEQRGSFTGTLNFVEEANLTGEFNWVREGKIVTLYIPQLFGTSDSSALTVTGLPNDILPSGSDTNFMLLWARDDGTDVVARARITVAGQIEMQQVNGGFTPTGQKGLRSSQLTYSIRTQ